MSSIEDFQRKLQNLSNNMPKCCNEIVGGLGSRVRDRAKKYTPFKTGKLQRGFRLSQPKKRLNVYSIEVENNTSYATFVEYGHMVRNRSWYYPGFFMLTRAMDEVDHMKTGIIHNYLRKYFK